MTPKPTTKLDLSWNERGRIGCAMPGHAPFEGSDAWNRERWHGITPRLAAGIVHALGREPVCDTCATMVRGQVPGSSALKSYGTT